MKKFTALFLIFALAFALASCGAKPAEPDKPDTPADDGKFTVGVCQLLKHDALDAATGGFVDGLREVLGDKVEVVIEIAGGEFANCSTICTGFVSDGVDLIMANATPALQAAAAATDKVPIIATSITDFASALDLSGFNGTTGKNISGSCDLAPLDEQAAMIKELFPNASTVGILFCSGESNSVYQADTITPFLEALGLTVKRFSFADSNDVAPVTQSACDECDVLFIPTDNTAADCGETINNVALAASTPIVAGEENACRKFGVATLSINYREIGLIAGRMAAKVLQGEDISKMPIEFAPTVKKLSNPAIAKNFEIEFPSDYTAMAD